jgi:hypothetical protein
MDYGQFQYIYEYILKEKQVDRIVSILDMTDSILIGNYAVSHKKGFYSYKRSKNRLMRKLRKLLLPEEPQSTMWNKMKKGKSYTIN